MISLDDGIAIKTEDHIKRTHHVNKRLERIYQCVTDITQSHTVRFII